MTALTSKTDARLMPLLLFALTLFSSSALMFVLQPLFGKLLLPLLGGSPAVWNTCMVFYQSLLFLGYLYAHTLSVRATCRQQIIIHISLLALSFLVLPVGLPLDNLPPTQSNPSVWVCTTLLAAIGLPFFVISTTAPLMQKWFAQLNHQHSADPYFLYAASNTGSLLALLSYPFLIEPHWGLTEQQLDWSIGYGLLGILLSGCALLLWRGCQQPLTATVINQATARAPLSLATQLRWLALAFVPSSLLLGLTNFISTDIASVPLLWIIPLTLYLLSFIIVFSRCNHYSHALMIKLQPLFLVVFLIGAFINPAELQYWAYLLLHIIGFFFAVMVCHGELAKSRPHTHYLTRFYLIMSLAGMLGGMFNTFVAPFIFKGIYEYPLMIIAALLLRPSLTPSAYNKQSLLQTIPAFALVSTGFLLAYLLKNPLDYFEIFAIALICLSVSVYWLRKQFINYALCNGALILLALGLHSLSAHTLTQQRSFFGVLSVRENSLINEQNQPETYYELFHGTTKHGAQRLTAGNQTTPLTYYSRQGPMGQLFAEYNNINTNWHIGAIGLGAGALACYAKPSQQWTFYEIDPLVVSAAQNSPYFSYLKRCAPHAMMRIGDARLSLNQEADNSFDLLLLDAFSSDAVPTHLITQEAINLYFKKLTPHGILAFHITNRHLALKKVLSMHAEQLHKTALIEEFSPEQALPLVVATDWVVMSNAPEDLMRLQQSNLGQWQTLPLYFNLKAWTDDFTNIVDIWK